MLHNKKLERPATDKYSSLFCPFVSNEEKKCCEYGPNFLWIKILFLQKIYSEMKSKWYPAANATNPFHLCS
jgi:hypothetical protein